MQTEKMTCGFGLRMHESAQKGLKEFDNCITDMFTWIDEYIADAKKTLNT